MLCFPKQAFRRAAQTQLAALCAGETVAAIWRRTLAIQAELKGRRPSHSAGVNQVLRYMEWDCALYRASQEYGISREQAAMLIEQINWALFGPALQRLYSVSRLRSAGVQQRVRWMLDRMFQWLFSAPFRRRSVACEQSIAFDVVACPLAAYFAEQGAAELTRHAACSLDYRMARQWGVHLARTQTIAEGAAHCDFRFSVERRGE